MTNAQASIKPPTQPCIEQSEDEIRLFPAGNSGIEAHSATLFDSGEKQAGTEGCPKRIPGSDVTCRLDPSVPARNSLIVDGSYSQNRILRRRLEPLIHAVEEIVRIRAVIIGKGHNFTLSGIQAEIARSGDILIRRAKMANRQAALNLLDR
jgi:hypothetical protein